ncbi:hypothetical protein FRC17_001133 [Serendipita sp. 399]|nr:hypothetical protein FRC17_001133 [Serendipita sp. 399]
MADAEAKAESQTRTKKRKRSSPEVNGSAEDADPGGQAETNDAPSLLTLRRSKRKKTSGNEVHDEAVESSPGASKATLAPVEVAGEPANSEVSHLEAEAHSILDTAAAGPEPSLHGSTSGQESDVQVGASSVLESRVQLSPLATKVYIRKAQKRRKRAQNDGEGANKKRKVETASSMREQDGSIVQATPTTRDDHSEPFEGNNQDNHGQLPRVDPSLHTGRRAKLPKPKPTNYSQLKRHQELLDVLREKGGILHISGELSVIVQSHSKSLEDQGIEAAIKSTFLMDKKTIAKDVETMEQKGLVKVIKTVILDPNRRVSLQQPATIFYLPEVSQEEVQKFIAGLNQPYKPTVARTNSRQIVDAVPFTKIKRPGTGKKDTNAIPPLDGSKGLEPRHQFLEDRQTVAQLSGFLLGKCRRAQELHLFTLKDILSENPSHHILSVENRVVATDYWTEDFPLGSFCAIIPVYTYIPFLEHAQSHPDILNQPLKTFDLRLRRALKIKHASVRARFWELFTILAELQLVTPLDQHSDGTIVVEVNGAPKRLGATAMPTTKSLPLPQFWKFEENVPVWLLSLARFSSQMIVEVPPFHKMLSVSDTNSALVFWSFLQQICDRGSKFSSLQSISTTPDETRFLLSPATLACLCNLHAWTSEYRLSRLQEEFLNRMIDAAALTTPLDDPTPDRVVRASHVTCAPQRVICDYFASRMDKLKASLRRLEEKKQHAEMAQALIASKRDAFVQKAENHLVNLDRKWDALVLDVVGDDISEEVENQLQILRSRYITVGGMVDDERLKDLIRNTVHDPVESAKNRHHKQGGQRAAAQSTLRANQIHRTIPTPSMPRTEELSNFTPRTVPQQLETSEPTNVSHSLPPLLSDRYKHTIKELISNMGPALSEDSFKVTRGKRIKPVGQKSATRRKRFVWNADYDELLQDAVAVMRARCRGGGRGMLWGPLQAIFPTMHANNIRTHFIKHVSQPGLANYMDRLEQGWHDLWKTHKGRSELMEESPFKADSLHLAGHIQFLRDYLDKQNLPPASPQKATLTTEKVTTRLSLPKHVKDLSYQYHVTENESPSFETSTQNYWGDTSVYLHERHQAISNLAFTESGEKSSASTSTDLSLAQNVIQMIIATEPENYTELHATSLLRPFGDTVIKRATNHLSKRGVISKVSGTKPGRAYRMCDSNAEDLSGRLPLRRCEDAAAIEEVFEDDPDAWRVWSLNPNEGEMAALLQKVSSHEVEFKIQPPDLETINAIAKWNSRKIQDDMVEVEVAVLFDTMESVSEADEVDNASVKSSDNELVIEFDEDESGHGLSTTGETASCCHAQRTARHVNCEACLTKALKVAIETLPHDVSEVALDLMRELDRGGGEGVRAELVWNRPNSQEVVTALTNVYPPLAFWSGYSSCQLISANYWTEYAVWVYEDSNGIDQSARRLVIPRRWIDMNGRTDVPIWKAAQRAVVGQLITRPVIRHLHLIELLHKVYDRLDILAVLRYLERQSIVKRMCTESASQHKVGEMTTWEEEHTMWELNERLDWSEFV